MASDVFSLIPHGVGIEVSFSLGRDMMSWHQTTMTSQTRTKCIIMRQFYCFNNEMLAMYDKLLDIQPVPTEEKAKLKTLANMADFRHFEESRAKRNEVRCQLWDSATGNDDPGFISDRMEAQVKTWGHFKHDGEWSFKAKSDLEREIALQPSQSTKRPSGRGGDFGVTKVKPLNPLESDTDLIDEEMDSKSGELADNSVDADNEGDNSVESDLELDEFEIDSELTIHPSAAIGAAPNAKIVLLRLSHLNKWIDWEPIIRSKRMVVEIKNETYLPISRKQLRSNTTSQNC
jgi:hypothetical protein